MRGYEVSGSGLAMCVGVTYNGHVPGVLVGADLSEDSRRVPRCEDPSYDAQVVIKRSTCMMLVHIGASAKAHNQKSQRQHKKRIAHATHDDLHPDAVEIRSEAIGMRRNGGIVWVQFSNMDALALGIDIATEYLAHHIGPKDICATMHKGTADALEANATSIRECECFRIGRPARCASPNFSFCVIPTLPIRGRYWPLIPACVVDSVAKHGDSLIGTGAIAR